MTSIIRPRPTSTVSGLGNATQDAPRRIAELQRAVRDLTQAIADMKKPVDGGPLHKVHLRFPRQESANGKLKFYSVTLSFQEDGRLVGVTPPYPDGEVAVSASTIIGGGEGTSGTGGTIVIPTGWAVAGG